MNRQSLLLSVLLIATMPAAADPVVIRVGNILGTPEPGEPGHHMAHTQRYFSDLVHEKSDGEVEIRFLEGKSLPTFQMPGMVEKGEIEATNVPGFFFTRVPELGVQAIPYLFEGLEHARRFPRSQPARALAGKIEKAYGVHVVSFMKIASTASVNSLESVRVPDDFKGKKVSNLWKLYRPMFEKHLPAHIREVGYAESVKGALVTGEFDVAMGQLQNTHFQKLYEYYPHQTAVPWFYNIYYTFIVNKKFWDSLTPKQQQAIDAAALETEAAAINFAEDAAQRHFQLLQQEGMKMHRQTKAERDAWKAAFQQPVIDGLLAASEDADATQLLIQQIQDLYP
jgi:TRAP-type C4-dicarboxylate transport system substrate-binding protein